jgi:hypothetical protein
MGYQQLSIDKVDVRLDATKTMREGIQQRSLVVVVVVGVGTWPGDRLVSRELASWDQPQDEKEYSVARPQQGLASSRSGVATIHN